MLWNKNIVSLGLFSDNRTQEWGDKGLISEENKEKTTREREKRKRQRYSSDEFNMEDLY